MDISLDLYLTAVLNLLILAAGAIYLYGSQRKSASAKSTQESRSTAAQPSDVSTKERKPSSAKQVAREALTRPRVDYDDDLSAADGKEYAGMLKRYSQKNGMGFISCSETYTLYNRDIRIYGKEVDRAGLSVGDAVCFKVADGRSGTHRGHPRAICVRKSDSLDRVCGEAETTQDGAGASLHCANKSNLNAEASEFVPNEQVLASTLNAEAAEFVPLAADPVVSSGELRADAAEFVPGSSLGAFPGAVSGSTVLRSGAAEYVPGLTNWDAVPSDVNAFRGD